MDATPGSYYSVGLDGSGGGAAGDAGAHTDLAQLQASVERLRQQRAQVERIKWETKKKDACITFLREEITKLNEQVIAAAEVQEENARMEAQMQVLQNKLAVANEAVRAKQHEVDKATEAKRGMEASFRDAVAQAEARQADERRKMQERIAELERKAGDSRMEAADAFRNAAGLEARVNALTAELTGSRDKKAADDALYRQQIEKLQHQLNSASFSKGEAEEHLRALTDEVQTKSGKLDAAERQLKGLEAHVDTLRKENAELESGSNYLRRQLARVEAESGTEVTNARHQVADLTAQVKARDELLERHEASAADASKRAESAEADNHDLRRRVEDLTAELERARQLLEASNATNASLTRRVSEAEQKAQLYQHEVAGLTQKLDAMRADMQHERVDREQWARARLDLISSMDDEEDKLQAVIDSTPTPEEGGVPMTSGGHTYADSDPAYKYRYEASLLTSSGPGAGGAAGASAGAGAGGGASVSFAPSTWSPGGAGNGRARGGDVGYDTGVSPSTGAAGRPGKKGGGGGKASPGARSGAKSRGSVGTGRSKRSPGSGSRR